MSSKSSLMDRLGFIQGRLSELVDGKIQAFPWESWKEEFPVAQMLGLKKIEWTLDQDRLRENPFNDRTGQSLITNLMEEHGISIPSVTGDCFMQAPFYKVGSKQREALLEDLDLVIESAQKLNTRFIVFPLVDNGRIENIEQEEVLIQNLLNRVDCLMKSDVKIVFESDFDPDTLRRLIGRLPEEAFGINYDVGNSAALGFDGKKEFEAYFSRIDNIHIKDRLLGGTTVPLGSGNVNFPQFFSLVDRFRYGGNFILQTARDSSGDHQGALARYRDFVLNGLSDEF